MIVVLFFLPYLISPQKNNNTYNMWKLSTLPISDPYLYVYQ